MLEIKNLNFYYGNNHILKNISFNAESGSLWGLMGPNGSGKTTFFKCILGLLKHTGSQIKINHLDYEKLNTSKLAKLISYVPQEHKPPFPFTVREMILMGRSPYMGGIFGLKKEDYIEAEKAIEMVNIADISDKLTAIYGELKAAIGEKISKFTSDLKKKLKSLFFVFGTQETDDEDKKIDEAKRTFELKTFIHQLYKKLKGEDEKDIEKDEH